MTKIQTRLKAASRALFGPWAQSDSSSPALYTPPSFPSDWWSRGWARPGGGSVAVSEACCNLICGVISSMQVRHVDGDEQLIEDSPANRIFNYGPNDSLTWPEYCGLALREVLLRGDSIAAAMRDERGDITELWPLERSSYDILQSPEDLSTFLVLNGADLTDPADRFIPARDFLQIRLSVDPDRPLRGLSRLQAAARAVSLSSTISDQQQNFHSGSARPGGVVETDQMLSQEQLKQIRASLNEMGNGAGTGRTPVLSNGLKFRPIQLSAGDTHALDLLVNANSDISAAFGVPKELLGGAGASSQYSVHKDVLSVWLSTSLGPMLELIEKRLARLFRIKPGERIEMDPSSLFKGSPLDQAELAGKLLGAGVITVDEARTAVGRRPIEGGDALRVPSTLLPALQPTEPEPDEAEITRAFEAQLDRAVADRKIARIGRR